MLDVTLYPNAASILDEDGGGMTFENLDYVSLVNNQTYGPPALIAPTSRPGGVQGVRARPNERVLYINTNLVPAFEIVRTEG